MGKLLQVHCYSHTYIEFVREKVILFDRWLNSQSITTFEGLRDLIIIEDFKNSLSKNVATFVGERKDLTPSSVAVLAVTMRSCMVFRAFSFLSQIVGISP